MIDSFWHCDTKPVPFPIECWWLVQSLVVIFKLFQNDDAVVVVVAVVVLAITATRGQAVTGKVGTFAFSSCSVSLPSVRIQTHTLVPTRCIKPMRAISLNLLIISRELTKMKCIWPKVNAACSRGFTPVYHNKKFSSVRFRARKGSKQVCGKHARSEAQNLRG